MDFQLCGGCVFTFCFILPKEEWNDGNKPGLTMDPSVAAKSGLLIMKVKIWIEIKEYL